MKPYRKLSRSILLSCLAVATCSAQIDETPAQRLLRERGSILDSESVDQRQQRRQREAWRISERQRLEALKRQRDSQTYEETIPVEAMPVSATDRKAAASSKSPTSNEQIAEDMAFFGLSSLALVAVVGFGLLVLGMPVFIFIGMLNTRATRKATEALLAAQKAKTAR